MSSDDDCELLVQPGEKSSRHTGWKYLYGFSAADNVY